MRPICTYVFLLTALVTSPLFSEEIETKFLIADSSIFRADFEDGQIPSKPLWQLRKSAWIIEEGILRGTNIDGNGPFIRLHSKENGGVLPENYVMKFSFMVKKHPDPTTKKKPHATRSAGHRFSFGHYAAKYQWRPEIGMDLAIGHGHAIEDARFHVERDQWYHVTAEIRGDEILVWFKDGPAYYMQHDHFRHKPSGWEFFTHIDEIGYLDNLQVWSLAPGTHDGWNATLRQIKNRKCDFVSSESPSFRIEKPGK